MTWGLDLGTANTVLTRWSKQAGRAEVVDLGTVCRRTEVDDPMLAPRTVPSATDVVQLEGAWAKLGRTRLFAPRVFWGRWGFIGRQALERNLGQRTTTFVPGFKHLLGRASSATVAHNGESTWTARAVARVFLRELLAEAAATTGERIRELVVTVPVESYETYRSEVSDILRGLGVHKLRFVDEPVAAAVGYGLGQRARRRVLVVDFGAGTLDLALVELGARSAEDGACEVIAKAGAAIGGDVVDTWIAADALAMLGVGSKPDAFWAAAMADEARRVKELTYARGRALWQVFPPEVLREAALSGGVPEVHLDQPAIRATLEARGLFDRLRECVKQIEERARPHGVTLDEVDDVLMVGGSTLLPGVYPLFEGLFGRDRVRAFRPFEAVALGAAAIAGGAVLSADHLVHSYVIRTVDAKTGAPELLTIVPRGTRFPTAPDLWRQHLVPTCALGEPERLFKLVICEVGDAGQDARLLGWDARGEVQVVRGAERLVVPLNDTAPVFGRLEPPHPPGDRRPRLEVSFGVNADRWLVTTVRDLWSNALLMEDRPVVRLL